MLRLALKAEHSPDRPTYTECRSSRLIHAHAKREGHAGRPRGFSRLRSARNDGLAAAPRQRAHDEKQALNDLLVHDWCRNRRTATERDTACTQEPLLDTPFP
jgi:hypothetical protein